MAQDAAIPITSEPNRVDAFPQEIMRFIEANIDSMDQLEILRILAADPRKEWSSAALARAVQTQSQVIATNLDALERRGLLTVSRGANYSCRYGLRTLELENEVTRLLRLYHERPVSLIQLLYAKSRKRCARVVDCPPILTED